MGKPPGMNESSCWGWRVEEYDPHSRMNPFEGALPQQQPSVIALPKQQNLRQDVSIGKLHEAMT